MRLRDALAVIGDAIRGRTYVHQLSADRSIIDDPDFGVPFAVSHPELLAYADAELLTRPLADIIREIDAARRERKRAHRARSVGRHTRRPMGARRVA